MAAPSQHAKLGASSSERWMKCPGSIQLSEGMPNESSVYAREGSCAHEVAAHCLQNNGDPDDWIGEDVKHYEDIEVTQEMADAVREYMDFIYSAMAVYKAETGLDDCEVVYEQRFDLTHIFHDMFGTADCVIYFPKWMKLLVCDFKYGQGIAVEVKENPQLMYYGLGAVSGKHNRGLHLVELAIVQPRCPHHEGPIRSWECTVEELLNFTDDLVAAAKLTEVEEPTFEAGDWCKFCPAAAICQTLNNRAFEIACAEFDSEGRAVMPKPEDMTIDELKLAWENAGLLKGMVASVQAYAHSQALEGKLLPETKLVNGRSNRRWKDKEAAEEQLTEMVDMGMLKGDVVKSVLKSPAQIEALCGKKHKGIITDLWEKGLGKLSLVPMDDPRQPARIDAIEEFSYLTEENNHEQT